MIPPAASRWPFFAIYVLYFAGWGILVPYFNYFLVEQGYSKSVASWVFSVYPLMTIFGPPIWGYWVDRRLDRRKTLSLITLSSAASFCLFLLLPAAGWLFAIMALFSFFATSFVPMADAMTLRNVGDSYGTIRGTGTIAFMSLAFLGGVLQDVVPPILILLFIPASLLLLTGFVLTVPDDGGQDRAPERVRYGAVLRELGRLGLWPFFLFAMFQWISLTPHHYLFSVYLKELLVRQGYENPGSIIGISFVFGTGTEILLFLFSNRILRSFRIKTLLFWVIAASLVRWTVMALALDARLVLLVQTLHCFSFAAFYLIGTRLVATKAPKAMRNSFQTIWSSLVFGLGGVIGGVLTGLVAERFPVENIYWLSNLFVLAGAVPLSVYLSRNEVTGEQLTAGP